MSELTIIRNKRKGHRGYITRTIKQLEEIIREKPKDEVQLSEFKIKLLTFKTILQDKIEVLKLLHHEALGLLNENELEDEIISESDFQAIIQENVIKIEQWILRNERIDRSDTISIRSSNTESNSFAKLPKLQLKSFDGNVLNFQTFWDTFDSAVNKNENLDDVTKFNYL